MAEKKHYYDLTEAIEIIERLKQERDDLKARLAQQDADLKAAYDAFGIGNAAREPQILMMNISNAIRRSACLSSIERAFFMVPGERDENYPDDECLLRWGASPDVYVAQFHKALNRIMPAQPSPAMGYWRLLNIGEVICKDDEFLYSGSAWRKALPMSVGDKYDGTYRIARRRFQPSSREDALTAAARDVLAERRRQVDAEDWTPEHDDTHAGGEMAGAAACYAVQDITHWSRHHVIRTLWPWAEQWWKPSSRRRNLEKAGALILAEIERLDRATMQQGGQ